MFKTETLNLQSSSYLKPLGELFTSPDIDLFLEAKSEASRVAFDGLITVTGNVGTQRVSVIYNDFRVNGGSFGKAVSKRAIEFLAQATETKTPVVLVLNSIGVRIMEGRQVFAEAFGLIPALAQAAKKVPVFSLSIGRTLGLGAVLFSMAHLRLAVAEDSLVNLTGPEVIKLFFGGKFDFEKFASAENQFERSRMIHEVVRSKDEGFLRLKQVLSFLGQTPIRGLSFSSRDHEGEHLSSSMLYPSEEALYRIMDQFDGPYLEVFGQMNSVVRTFLVRHGHHTVGVFINPPRHPQNLINSQTLNRYSAALDLFKSMQIPVVSILDTAGVDPRGMDSRDADIVLNLVEVASKIIEYPFGKMGIIQNRCFGGATLLVFPKIFGGEKTYAVEGCTVGIMHPNIITQVLSGSSRLLEKWEETAKTQTADLKDILDQGIIDDVIQESQISQCVGDFLARRDMAALTTEESEGRRRPILRPLPRSAEPAAQA